MDKNMGDFCTYYVVKPVDWKVSGNYPEQFTGYLYNSKTGHLPVLF